MESVKNELDNHVLVIRGRKIPESVRHLTAEEIKMRKDILSREHNHLNREYQSLPLTSNTLRSQALRSSLDNSMRTIERLVGLLENPNLCIPVDKIWKSCSNPASGDQKTCTA
ncbi:hypothetical protein GJ496_000368 [Pomphorhynchus laevis]|nr:hypothetical protein GJ496_000368 [Pomphorhynchus laevis]